MISYMSKGNGVGELRIVGGVSGKMPEIPSGLKHLDVFINSLGGDFYLGLEAYRSILGSGCPDRVAHVLDAMSAATLPMCACNEIRMRPDSVVMIHGVTACGVDVNHEDALHLAHELEAMNRQMVGIYASASGGSESDIAEMVRKETYLMRDDMRRMGFHVVEERSSTERNSIERSSTERSSTDGCQSILSKQENATNASEPIVTPSSSAMNGYLAKEIAMVASADFVKRILSEERPMNAVPLNAVPLINAVPLNAVPLINAEEKPVEEKPTVEEECVAEDNTEPTEEPSKEPSADEHIREVVLSILSEVGIVPFEGKEEKKETDDREGSSTEGSSTERSSTEGSSTEGDENGTSAPLPEEKEEKEEDKGESKVEEAVKAERERVTRLSSYAGLADDEMIEKAIEQGVSVTDFAVRVLDQMKGNATVKTVKAVARRPFMDAEPVQTIREAKAERKADVKSIMKKFFD